MSYELEGKIKVLQETKTFNGGFTKRELVVTVQDGDYPQDISLEFLKDKISLLDNIFVDDEVVVTFDIRGREYNGRYFNNLIGWKIAKNSASEDVSSQPSAANDWEPPIDFVDDVPF